MDSNDATRLQEVRETFRQLLKNEKVRGKPILLLCNKTDLETAQERDVIVDILNVERFVNEARCPTRVDRTIANKAEGFKDGFKWLVKSIIANLADLGPRVEADVEMERRAEAKRKEELRRRIEERKRAEEEQEAEIEDEIELETANKGFVPMSELKEKWATQDQQKKGAKKKDEPPPASSNANGNSNGVLLAAPASYLEPLRPTTLERLPKIAEESGVRRESAATAANGEVSEVSMPDTERDRKSQSNGSILGALPPLVHNQYTMTSQSSLDLEPVSQPRKKKNLMKRLKNGTSPMKTLSATVMPMTPAVRNYRSGSIETLQSCKANSSSKSVSSAESLRDSQVIKAYS